MNENRGAVPTRWWGCRSAASDASVGGYLEKDMGYNKAMLEVEGMLLPVSYEKSLSVLLVSLNGREKMKKVVQALPCLEADDDTSSILEGMVQHLLEKEQR